MKISPEIRNQLSVLLIYCLPCLVAFSIILCFSYGRFRDAKEDIFCTYNMDMAAPATEVEVAESDEPQDTEAKSVECDAKSSDQEFKNYWGKNRRGIIFETWSTNLLFVFALALLPFLVLGIGLVFSEKARNKISELGLNPKTEIRRFAAKNWGMKFIVAFIIVFGWTYVFFPKGQKATIIESYNQETLQIQEEDDRFAGTTVPIFFRVIKSPILYFIIPFLGWYLYLVSYFLQKLYKNDVIGSRVYALLFRKFLFVLGIALALESSGNSSLIAAFIIGYLPLSTPSVLKELGVNLLTDGGTPERSLLTLPGISRWDVYRLEEEGISDIASLATANRRELLETLPNAPSQVNLWVDTAILMTVLGPDKYNEIKKLSLTASYFVQRLKNDEQFAIHLEEQHDIKNAPELIKIISETFSVELP